MAKSFEDKVKDAGAKADDSFWKSIVKSFPEVDSGDFPPEDNHAWNEAVKRALLVWLMFNYPTEEGQEKARKMLRES